MSHLLAAAAGTTSLTEFVVSMFPIFLIIAIFWLIVFVPMRRKQKAHEQLLADLKKGDKVITNGGLYGEVVKVEGSLVLLKLAENVKVRISRQAVAGLQEPPAEKSSG
ncbi:MAG TPA: preprotein translocase subunit YajC [Thermoanaerobaculia bacterium]|jgi:preprotein translocase subunit YajC